MTPETTMTASPDPLDQAFAGYLKAKVPAPWPDAPTPPAVRPRSPAWAGRLALAASVAAVLAVAALLPGPAKPTPVAPGVPDAQASGEKLLREVPKATAPPDAR